MLLWTLLVSCWSHEFATSRTPYYTPTTVDTFSDIKCVYVLPDLALARPSDARPSDRWFPFPVCKTTKVWNFYVLVNACSSFRPYHADAHLAIVPLVSETVRAALDEAGHPSKHWTMPIANGTRLN